MFVVQTSRARRTRKYSILMTIILLLCGAFGAVLTLHWDVRPRKE
jgi:hypothetical protein